MILGLLFALVLTTAPAVAGPDSSTEPPSSERAAPGLRVTELVQGLEHPWDVQPIGGGRVLITERDSARLLVAEGNSKRRVRFPSGRVWVSGETGLMSVAVDTDRRQVWACHGAMTGRGPEVRVSRWRVDKGWRSLSGRRTMIAGLPATSGRHGGCRLLLERQGPGLVIGTGDAAVGTNPRDLDSLGGKVLRINRRTGAPMTDNPFAGAADDRRYVYTYGHRNVQGLAQRADGSLWSVEHGSSRDDEVNLLVPGGDYGWHPVPGYDESVPMTDQSLPGEQQEAAWSSGFPTIATSGAAWVLGRQWGSLDGSLAVAALKGSEVRFLRFDDQGTLVGVTRPASLQRFGRLRSVTSARNGDLLLTTDNGIRDRVLRVSPR